MDQDLNKYLATEVLSEQRTISYRNVSRVFKVHVNAAKCILYEFYEFQNGKKPGSIYATYLLSGIKKRPTPTVTANATTNGQGQGHGRDFDPDEHIPSSPPPFTSSMLEPSQQSSQAGEEEEEEEANNVLVRTISLVKEDALEELKEQYETITSIHIYSLSPTRIQDLFTLSDIGRNLFNDVFVEEDPLQHNKTYGVIQNPNVRRRKGNRPAIPSGPAPKFQPVKEEAKKASALQSKPAPKSGPAAGSTKAEEPSRPSSRDSTSTTTSSKPSKQPPLKRDSSDLFKAFAKQGHKKSTPTSTPKVAPQDATMKDVDDDEGESEDEALFLDTNTRKPVSSSKKRPSDVKKEKEDRAAKLRKLMDSDDEEVAAVPNVGKATGLESDEPVAAQRGTDADVPSKDAGEDEQIAWSESDGEKKKKPAVPNKIEGPPKRRRGKRKVMKKRTTKDEDGYLVTKEEAVWESFSEDEPEPAPARNEMPKRSFGPAKASSQSQSQSQSQGKAAAKKKTTGGGNIMSFFGKKSA
ncbi:DNA polymerase delta subunit 3 [Cladophialophora carrionii]|uniref:DNA polymerase delta subunit 3 n=1 Tax=Cladophialophora carrionii TaxID=86049 RepID=A0A1C1C9I7_9EURO|nr:DNA polymerase delta subunit 3 [Cladophialophora carrionii]